MKRNGGCLAELEGKGGGEWGVAGGQKESVVAYGFELLCGCVVCLRLRCVGALRFVQLCVVPSGFIITQFLKGLTNFFPTRLAVN
jgi:hypothetical protein